MSKTYIKPDTLLDSTRFGFSQGVVTSGGRTVYLSGQVGWDKDGNIIAGFQEQTDQIYRNIEAALESVGGTFNDVVSMRVYVLGEYMSEIEILRKALRKYFPDEHKPATTLLGVQALARPGLLLEIEAIAVIE